MGKKIALSISAKLPDFIEVLLCYESGFAFACLSKIQISTDKELYP